MKKDKTLLGDLQALTVFYFEEDRHEDRYIATSKTYLDAYNRPRRIVMNMNNGQLKQADILIPVVALGSTIIMSLEPKLDGLEARTITIDEDLEIWDGVEYTRRPRTPNNMLADFGRSWIELDELAQEENK